MRNKILAEMRRVMDELLAIYEQSGYGTPTCKNLDAVAHLNVLKKLDEDMAKLNRLRYDYGE